MSLPEVCPAGKSATVTNLRPSRTVLDRTEKAAEGKGVVQSRLILGRAADASYTDEPPASRVLSPAETVKWWPTLRRWATGTDEHPAAIAVSV